MKYKALPERQLEVMQVLWNSDEAMTAADIVNFSDMAINTVQASLRSLTAKGYVKQDKVVYSGTVLARTYIPVVSQEKYLEMACEGLMRANTTSLVMTTFVRKISNIAMLDELEEKIKQRKKELENECQREQKRMGT